MDVKKIIMEDEWEVDFVSKKKENDTYPTIGYSVATVEKQKSGCYKGIIINPGGPNIRIRR